jgi:serine/threonine-protein kinase RsbW
MIHRAHFPGVRSSTSSARRFACDAVGDVPGEVADAIALIASELATNCVRHAASAFEIRIERLPESIRIEVEDDGDGEPVVRSPEFTATSGRGMQIVQALADEWGVIPKSGAPGKTVWATVALRTTDRGIAGSGEAYDGQRQSSRSAGSAASGIRRRGAGGSDEVPGGGPRMSTSRSTLRCLRRFEPGHTAGVPGRPPVTTGSTSSSRHP